MPQTIDVEAMNRALGRRIVALRQARKLKQIDIVRRSGVSQRTMTSIERGRGSPSIRTLAKIAVALDMPWQELVNFRTDPPPMTF